MNNPIDEPVSRAADDFELEANEKQSERDAADVLDPSRWWFASTACPLIAGCFGPMANAFSICALANSWRVYIPQGLTEGIGSPIPDPHWLIGVNTVSLACALVANLALLLNMARKARFAIAQPITIVGFLVASGLLIALVIVASTPVLRLRPASEHANSQAFYYAIMAAAIYFVISLLMVTTVVGAYRGHYPKQFRLTTPQRTLMLQTISFMAYLLLGALMFCKTEGWLYLDAVYFCDFTLLTVGIGDYAPTTHLGRSLLFPFAITGIVSVGLIVGSIRSLVLDRGKTKLKARFTEKRRERALSTVDAKERTIRIGFFRTTKFSQDGLSEAQRREQEFLLMRKIHQAAQTQRRWTALVMSTLGALSLSLLGAVVFWRSEQPQAWSYFQSFYFTYVSLLTIGYGDISPISNAGKAFFVFWSLLAVPTLTILISNMGDTIVKVFRDLVIWVGSFTVLPGDSDAPNSFRSALDGLKHYIQQASSMRHGLLPESSKREGTQHKLHRSIMDRLATYLERDRVLKDEDAEPQKKPALGDAHFYNFVLVSEIRKVMKDLKTNSHTQYSYNEWAYFLKLLGQDETSPRHHRHAPVQGDQGVNNGEKADIGTAGTGNTGEETLKWSWLGLRSPMMGGKTEPEWLLEHLTVTLEQQLRLLQATDSKVKANDPPVSRHDVLRYRNGRQEGRYESDLLNREKQSL